MNAQIEIYRISQGLKAPYRLSFATLNAFETLIVVFKGNGGTGYGEITPLPGYSAETIAGAGEAVCRFALELERGTAWSDALAGIAPDNPMVASGLWCARQTAEMGPDFFTRPPTDIEIPLNALCDGRDTAEIGKAAKRLYQTGYRNLKMKVGQNTIETDIERVTAASANLGEDGSISIDANQRLGLDEAHRLCEACESLPVRLIEQPFATEAWAQFATLAKASPVPLMLDESIWNSADVLRAGEQGARLVKLKLCKHPGIAATLDLIETARSAGLGVVFGNGVQGSIGNHIEAMIYARSGLQTPAELTGALKLTSDRFGARLSVSDGKLISAGLDAIELAGLALVAKAVFTL